MNKYQSRYKKRKIKDNLSEAEIQAYKESLKSKKLDLISQESLAETEYYFENG